MVELLRAGQTIMICRKPGCSPLSAEETDDEVDKDSQYGTDYQASHDREEEPEIPLLQEDIAGQPPQERNLAPEREK